MCEWCRMRIFPVVIREDIADLLIVRGIQCGLSRDELRARYCEFMIVGSLATLPPSIARLFQEYADCSYN